MAALNRPLTDFSLMDCSFSPSGLEVMDTSHPVGTFRFLFTRTLRTVPSVHSTRTVCITSAPLSVVRERLEDCTTP